MFSNSQHSCKKNVQLLKHAKLFKNVNQLNEPRHKISKNVVCGMCDQQRLIPACAYAQSDQRLCWSLEYKMLVKLLIEHHLGFLSLKGGCTDSYGSTLDKIPRCWKSHATYGPNVRLYQKGWYVYSVDCWISRLNIYLCMIKQ